MGRSTKKGPYVDEKLYLKVQKQMEAGTAATPEQARSERCSPALHCAGGHLFRKSSHCRARPSKGPWSSMGTVTPSLHQEGVDDAPRVTPLPVLG